jgi:hypothetical protein
MLSCHPSDTTRMLADMALRRRAPITGKRLLTIAALIGFAVFFVLVLDGAEVVRAGLAGLATTVWIIALIAGLNWYNRYRSEMIANIVRESAGQGPEDHTLVAQPREGDPHSS